MRPGVRPGVRLGIDVGSVRVGVAACDPSGLIASPVETVHRATVSARDGADPAARTSSDRPSDLPADVVRIIELAAELGAVEVIVGLPLSLSGKRGAAADAASDYARKLAQALQPVPVRLVDERLSTVSAHGNLATAGLRSRARRDVVDQQAAVIILQSALDTERTSGRIPGELVIVTEGGRES
ncbi:MAG: Holliday junction resolvase RuvX [Acidothermaceae bacterium]